ncbi:MAG TPA: secondary thiamine-phosphate synthase enzyme YjbQ [Phycisphaerae bacterium]|nr:secondary thiamine-phosphate synthase enzyme YjbQ [Phycisphaerae bacterium]HOJ75514.1 secondary thiamine-phosphate synthase enzyme YjbQ [Phycisphaerae bacterium]HOM52850.1 secondary thiamine-phosphate synthase enzyme YjbQ [Phycisphaerae bacterium]HON67107.1 secondary thiamine-phosphate synthase enzyme YjbQ [Phycisphaerae bacterium]HOQ86875.1 secondary thiamine-phosphate synthase enzyme YjbQ [Phycisphaerae bacterium]
MQSITVQTHRRCEMLDVTSQVAEQVRSAGLQNGYVICYVPHTTAGITIQENADPDVVHDVLYKLEQLVPQDDPGFRHGEGNSDAHLKASLTGLSQIVLVEDGRLVLGTWQGIYFCEYDGPRRRQLFIKCVKA